MFDSMRNVFHQYLGGLSRRELFRRSALLTMPAFFRGHAAAAAAAAPAAAEGLRVGQDIYQSIGVRPLINARGTFTIISGSRMLPEVRAAMDAAAQHHVHLDELMAAIGARLAELTKAEWGWCRRDARPASRMPPRRASPGATPISTCGFPISPGFRRTK
jgi:L-seryl-tRNA(Ser) seleniumtransferase